MILASDVDAFPIAPPVAPFRLFRRPAGHPPFSHPHPREARGPCAPESLSQSLQTGADGPRWARISDLGIKSPAAQDAADCNWRNLPAIARFPCCNRLQRNAPFGDRPVPSPYAHQPHVMSSENTLAQRAVLSPGSSLGYCGSGFGPVAVTSFCCTQLSTWTKPSKRTSASSTTSKKERR